MKALAQDCIIMAVGFAAIILAWAMIEQAMVKVIAGGMGL